MAKILVACEESQAVTKEFRALGHEAYSCDILPCSGGHPEWHKQDSVVTYLELPWDMIIAFPPCTHLAVSGARHFEQKRKDGRQKEGIEFFMLFANNKCPRIAIENPIGIMSTIWREPDQIINPYNFGDPFQKHTCLWLKGLPRLIPSHYDAPLFNISVDKGEFVEFKSGKRMSKWMANSYGDGSTRSKTFPGIAKAMATQWSAYLEKEGVK